MEGEAVLTSRQSRAILMGGDGTSDHARALDILRAAARYHAGGVVHGAADIPGLPGLRASDIPSMPMPAAPVAAPVTDSVAPQAIAVRIDNRGAPQRVTASQARFDLRRTVIEIVTDDIVTGGAVHSAINATGNGEIY